MIDIDNLQPGTKLNELVAERVLGWRHDPGWCCLIPPEQIAKPSEMWTDWQEGEDEDGEYYLSREPVKGSHVPGVVYNGGATEVILPDFSGDIADAWRVVYGLEDSHLPSIYHDGQLWICEFRDGQDKFVANAETACHAICLAALKVVKAKKG